MIFVLALIESISICEINSYFRVGVIELLVLQCRAYKKRTYPESRCDSKA